MALGHLAAKPQPGGGENKSGGVPAMGVRGWLLESQVSNGMARFKPMVPK